MGNAFAMIQIHHFAVGAAVSGVAPDGTDSEEYWERGRLRKWKDCTVGGLFTFYVGPTVHQSHSACLRQVAWNLDKLTDIIFAWRDPDGIWVPFYEAATDFGLLDLQQVMLFPHAGALRVTATGAAAADAEVVTWWDGGRFEDTFTHTRLAGSFALP